MMQKKRSSKQGSRIGWLLALGWITAAAFAAYAMKPLWFDGPAAVKPSPVYPDAAETFPVSLSFAPTIPNARPAPIEAPPGMVWIPGGEFSMGSTVDSDSLCSMPGMTRDASPVHRVYVDGFWMDATELTNEEFARFIKATGYVTLAERPPTAA